MPKPSQRSGLRAAHAKSRSVDPRPITGREKPAELLAHAFGAYVGRQERTAFELERVMVDGTLAGPQSEQFRHVPGRVAGRV